MFNPHMSPKIHQILRLKTDFNLYIDTYSLMFDLTIEEKKLIVNMINRIATFDVLNIQLSIVVLNSNDQMSLNLNWQEMSLAQQFHIYIYKPWQPPQVVGILWKVDGGSELFPLDTLTGPLRPLLLLLGYMD